MYAWKQTSDIVVLNAALGEKFQLRVTVLQGDPSDFYVTARQAGQDIMNYTALGIPSEIFLGMEAVADGDIVITLENYGGGSHQIEVEAIRP